MLVLWLIMTSFTVSWRHASRCGALLLTASLVVACGGGAKSSSSSDPDPKPPTNSPPTISGTPDSVVTRDQAYDFTPIASDPDGDTLSFSISSTPAWASFDPLTGNLSGTPGEVDIGMTTGITISVSDGEVSVSLAPFDLEVRQIALGSATVSWSAPSTNADGSTLTDLAGFRVHYGTASQSYSNVVEINDDAETSVLIDELEPGTYFFAVTALDLTGNESALSAEVSKVVDP